MTEWTDVTSSNIRRIKHDPDTSTLHIEFKDGRRGTHGNISADQFDQLQQADSIGGHYARFIRGRAAHPWEPHQQEPPPATAGTDPDEKHPLAHIEGIDDV